MERPQYANVLITQTFSMRKHPHCANALDTPTPSIPQRPRYPSTLDSQCPQAAQTLRTLLEPVYVKDSFQVVNFVLEDYCSEAFHCVSDC